MNYFEEMKRAYGEDYKEFLEDDYFMRSEIFWMTGTAKVYIDFCEKNLAMIIHQLIASAFYCHKDMLVSEDIIDNFERCFEIRKNIFLSQGYYPSHGYKMHSFDCRDIIKYLVSRDDFCTPRILNALNICEPYAQKAYLAVFKYGSAEKLDYFILKVNAEQDFHISCWDIDIIKNAQNYEKYLDWAKPNDMVRWYSQILSLDNLNDNCKKEFIDSIKTSELEELLKDFPIFVKELEKRNILAEYNLISTLPLARPSICNKV